MLAACEEMSFKVSLFVLFEKTDDQIGSDTWEEEKKLWNGNLESKIQLERESVFETILKFFLNSISIQKSRNLNKNVSPRHPLFGSFSAHSQSGDSTMSTLPRATWSCNKNIPFSDLWLSLSFSDSKVQILSCMKTTRVMLEPGPNLSEKVTKEKKTLFVFWFGSVLYRWGLAYL